MQRCSEFASLDADVCRFSNAEAPVGRLVYIPSHGCKENLIARPQDWPGLAGGSLRHPTPHRPVDRGDLIRSHPRMGSAPARRGVRRPPVRDDRNREPRSFALLAASLARAVPRPDRRVDRGDHRPGRRPPSGDGNRAPRPGRDPPVTAVLAAGEDQEFARAAGPRRQQASSDSDEDRLRLVRQGFPRGGLVSARRRPARSVSFGELSARFALCSSGSVGDQGSDVGKERPTQTSDFSDSYDRLVGGCGPAPRGLGAIPRKAP